MTLRCLRVLIPIAALIASARAAAPQTQPTSAAEEARLKRGVEVRRVLLEALKEADSNGGMWPDELKEAAAAHLIYTKPAKLALTWDDAARAGAIVALHEPMEKYATGVWVAFSDGHLEFVTTREQLAACKDRLRIVERFLAAQHEREAREQKEIASGELTLRVVDEQGVAVAGALVGCRGHFGFAATAEDPRVDFESEEKDGPARTRPDGVVKLTALRVFGKENEAVAPLSLYIVHEERDLVAVEDLKPAEFGRNKVREVRLHPACHVKGTMSSVGLFEMGRTPSRIEVAVCQISRDRSLLGYVSENPSFNFPLASGTYRIQVHFPGSITYLTWCYVEIQQGQRELNLQPDARPYNPAQLLGRKAPELREIKAWKNDKGVKLSELEGKVVLLDFWGTWCGVCLYEMPQIMALHDEFKDKGLVVIGIHDDSVGSIEEMDSKLQRARKEAWKGRDLPFLVALDGGGLRRIAGTAQVAQGATTAAYGVDRFPTTLLIGRDGTVRKDVFASDARAEIEKLLKEEWPKAK